MKTNKNLLNIALFLIASIPTLQAMENNSKLHDPGETQREIPKEELALQLINAVESEDIDEINRLIEDGIDVNQKDLNGWSALLGAAAFQQLECLQKLLENKANPNIQAPNGITPLMQAVLSYNQKLMNALINAKADLEIKDKNGRTAFLHAKNLDCMRLLQKAGANIHAIDNNEDNAFSIRIGCLKDEEAKFMIEAGIDWSIAIKKEDTTIRRCPFYAPKHMSQFLKLTAKQKEEIYALLLCLKNIEILPELFFPEEIKQHIAQYLYYTHKQTNEQRVRTTINAMQDEMSKDVFLEKLNTQLNKEVIHENK